MLALPDGGWALTGIRFRGLDITLPFVDVVATTTGPTPREVAEVAVHVASSYAAFRPRCVRFDVPDPDALVTALAGQADGTRAEVDQYVVAGPVSALRERATRPSYERVSLRPGEPGPLAVRAAAIFADLHQAAPQTTWWANAEDVDSLAACAAGGLLFEVLVDGEPAGVVAALREDAHGLLGYVVQELCLDGSHRGRGLAAPVLQHLVRALPDGEARRCGGRSTRTTPPRCATHSASAGRRSAGSSG